MNMEDQYLQLKKESNLKENEWKKDKAVYLQRIQLLDLQLEEYRLREQNQKQLNDTIMSALNDVSKPQNKVFKDLLHQFDNQSKDSKKNDTIREIEFQYRQLKVQFDDQQSQMKDLQYKYEKEIMQYKHQIEILEQLQMKNDKEMKDGIKNNDLKMEDREKMFKQQLDLINVQYKAKSDEKNIKMEQNYQLQIEQLVSSHTVEKDQLNARITKCQSLIKKYQSHLDNNRSVQEIENAFTLEISKLRQQISQQEIQHENEKKQLMFQFQEAEKIIQNHVMKPKKNEDLIRSSMKENVNAKFPSSHKKSNNTLILSKIENQCYSPINYQQNYNLEIQDSPKHCSSFIVDKKYNQLAHKNSEHIQSFKQSVLSTKNGKGIMDQLSCRIDTLPMSFDDYNNLQKKRNNGSSTNSLSINPTISVNDNSFTSSQNRQQNNDIQNKWIQNQLTQRQNIECLQQQLKKTDMIRKASQTSIKQLNNILGYHNDTNDRVDQYENSLENIIMETSLEQNKDTEQGGYFQQPDTVEGVRIRGFSQKPSRTQGSGVKVHEDSYIHDTFNPALTQRMNTNHRVGKMKPRYQFADDTNELENMGLSNIERNIKEQMILMNASSKASNDSQVNQEIKYLISKLLKAKGKLTEGLKQSHNKTQSMSVLGKVNEVSNQTQVQQITKQNSFYAQHRKTNQSVQIFPKTKVTNTSLQFLQKPRHLKIRSNYPDMD